MSQERNSAVNPEFPDDLKLLEAELSRLQPRRDRLDCERLIFLAGQASVSANRVWPVAFAAMTAVAATLFGLIVTRPSSTESLQNEKVAVRVNSLPQSELTVVEKEHPNSRGILTASDVLRFDSIRFSAQRELPHASPSLDVPAEEPTRTILTPASWHQLIDDKNFAGPSLKNSSIVFPIQGTNT